MTLLLSVIATIISISGFVISLRNLRRSQRLEFLQRRDQLSLKISDLNAKVSEIHLISARFEIVLLNQMSSPVVDDTHSEKLKTQIARIKELRRKLELDANRWDETLHQLHSGCNNLTLDTDPVVIEQLITNVQIASDDIKQRNGIHLASLHTLETIEPMQRTSVDRIHELEKQQAELNLEESIRKIKGN